MRYLIPLCLLVASCGASAPDKPRESRIVLLKYRTDSEKSAEEDRLNKLLKAEGWRVVQTETKSQEIRPVGTEGDVRPYMPDKDKPLAEWNVTVTLERP